MIQQLLLISEMHDQGKTWPRTWILYHTDLPEMENGLWNFWLLLGSTPWVLELEG